MPCSTAAHVSRDRWLRCERQRRRWPKVSGGLLRLQRSCGPAHGRPGLLDQYMCARTCICRHPHIPNVCVYIYIHMYICKCVCVCLCMYIYVCMWVCVCMHVCMYACMHVCMYACMHVCMYGCMYLCMCRVVSCRVVSCHVMSCHVM